MSRVRRMRPGDIDRVVALQERVYANPWPKVCRWTHEHLQSHLRVYPDGQWVITDRNGLIGSATTCILNWSDFQDYDNWFQLTDWGELSTHNPEGDTLFLVDLAVDPLHQARGHGRKLFEHCCHQVAQSGLHQMVGVVPLLHYHNLKNQMTAEEYVRAALTGEVHDTLIRALDQGGMKALQIMPAFFPDWRSVGFAVLARWSCHPEEPHDQVEVTIDRTFSLGAIDDPSAAD